MKRITLGLLLIASCSSNTNNIEDYTYFKPNEYAISEIETIYTNEENIGLKIDIMSEETYLDNNNIVFNYEMLVNYHIKKPNCGEYHFIKLESTLLINDTEIKEEYTTNNILLFDYNIIDENISNLLPLRI